MEHAVLSPEDGQKILEKINPDNTQGGQFIIVHGSSFRRALDPHRVEMVHYPNLFDFLVNKVGKALPCIREPIMVAPVNLSQRIQDVAKGAGFNVWLAHDVQLEIEGFLQTMDRRITSITLVSNEISDCTLEMLLEYARSGIAVHFVGTTTGDRDGGKTSEKIHAAVSSLCNLDFIDISTAIENIALSFHSDAVRVMHTSPKEPTPAKKIFALVNGASFASAMQLHNVGVSDYRVLYHILVNEIGMDCEHAACPVMIGSPRMHSRTQEEVCTAGFDLIMASDGKKIGDWMLEKVLEQDPQTVSRLVIVANTLSYLREALLEKEKAGMDIYIVSTRLQDKKRGRPMLDPEDDFMISANAHMHFVEIGQYANQLMKVPLQLLDQKQTRTLILTFDIPPGANPDEVECSLVRSVSNFLARHSIREGNYTIRNSG
ncbi:MAG: hypothetical protein HY617_00665 [Candidatus Sungbacteria bacterium]|nr:hypothetical protein [Candidatus Sungbacteria bacterium]